ncbi:MAG: magnesium transporter CorA family protein [Endomicrobium sp.]|jgi:magnesium transporter|nr:magnesium transporter CorA family protein [Endomicrobium sp.]
MIKAIYLTDGIINADDDALKILEYRDRKPDLTWIDIYLENHELSQEETTILSEFFKFHEMSIEDCLFPQYYPKMEEFDGYVFGAIHGIQLKPHYFKEFEDSIYELNIFIGKNFIVTVHAEELFFLDNLFEKVKAKPQVEMRSLENMLYNIFNKVVSSYGFTLEKIDNKIENLENDILKDPESEIMEEILDTKKVIFSMRKIAEPQQATYFYFTRANNNLISKEYLVYFRDIHMQCVTMNQSILMRSQMVVNLLEVYMSSITVRLTEVMKFLTVIATIVMPVLIISGYYGMNVKFIEKQIFGEKGMWLFAVSLMLVTIIAMLIYFKKKKWF